MLPHDGPFLLRQRAWLEQDRIGHGHLADIVDDASPPQGLELLVGESNPFAETHRVVRQTLAVSLRVRVFGLDAPRQSKQDGLSGFQFVGMSLQAEQGTHARQQLAMINGLAEKIVCPHLDSTQAVLMGCQACRQHHRRQPGGGIRFEPPANFKPIHMRHDHIEQHQIGLHSYELFQCLLAVTGSNDMVTPCLQNLLQQKAIARFVIHNQDRTLHPPTILLLHVTSLPSNVVPAKLSVGLLETKQKKRPLSPLNTSSLVPHRTMPVFSRGAIGMKVRSSGCSARPRTSSGSILDPYERTWQGQPLRDDEFVLSADE